MRFDGKVALVSGAGSGIGRATALAFAAHGARVAVADIDRTKAEAVVAEIAAAGGTAIGIVADAGTPAGIETMIGGAVRAFGGLDILHNNAFGQPALPPGRSRLAFTGDVDEAVWTHTIELGLTGVFRAMKRAIPELLARGGGAIVNTASISGLFADFAIGAYNAAKAGVINLTRVAAIEYAARGIRVNCVCPGPPTWRPTSPARRSSPTAGSPRRPGCRRGSRCHEARPRRGRRAPPRLRGLRGHPVLLRAGLPGHRACPVR